MKVEVRYGSKNKPSSPTQNLYIRVKHSKLDWDKCLFIKINAEDWDFKKREIIHHIERDQVRGLVEIKSCGLQILYSSVRFRPAPPFLLSMVYGIPQILSIMLLVQY